MADTRDLGPLPRWDLSNVFPALESDELKAAIAHCDAQLGELERYLDAQSIAKDAPRAGDDAIRAALDGYLERVNDLIALYHTIGSYIRAFVATDSFNQTARRMLSEIEPMGVRLHQIDVRFSGWVGSIADALPRVTAQPGPAQAHAFYLRETAEQSRYLMSEAEESLAAELSLSGANAWSKLQGTITSQLTVDFARDGKVEKLPMPALINIMQHDPDPNVRRRAYEAEIAAWETVKEPLAAAMNGVKGATHTLDKRRGRRDPLHAALDHARIDRETLDAMMGAMQDAFPMFRRYLRAKARRLGHTGGLPWWDLMAPVGRHERIYTWDEARAFILEHFAGFSPRLEQLARRAFDSCWIDAEQRPGKRAGAFCMGVPLVKESRILCNYDGSLDQVSTIAHELGHAYHNACIYAAGKTELQSITPMTLAETASILCENVITDAALAEARSADEELAILETDLIGKTQVIVDITSRYLFEMEVFRRRAKAELSADELCELMLRFQKETYGDGLDERYLHKFMWTWKPHYYFAGLSFYNFPYAFGLLFGLGLYAIYKQRGAAFVPEYEALLAGTGEDTAANLAARFGIDIRDRAFWKRSLDLIGERIERYVSL
ncbi:MAG: M3 family oligoendopeptidase [Anaerolineae bacterium]|nr:M3 family oligoendopeptidase [Candidatus Roseilinea sp.]MDW8451153.1 M3 family oligoendopeptidase [Anaerolineae bacterium]